MSCLLCDLGALHVQYSMSVCLDVRTYVRCGLLPVPMPLPVPVLVPAARSILVLSSLVLCLCCLLSLICECHVMCLQLQALANSTARHSPTATRQIATLTAIPCSAAVPVQYNSVHNRMSSPRIGLTPQQATILVCSIHTYANERMLESKAARSPRSTDSAMASIPERAPVPLLASPALCSVRARRLMCNSRSRGRGDKTRREGGLGA